VLPLVYRLKFSNEIMSKPYSEIDRLIKDQNGNHIIQKMIERGFCDNIHEVNTEFMRTKKIPEVVEKLKKLLEYIKDHV